MCTHITLKSSDNKYLSARTMDFSYDLSPDMVLYPRNSQLHFTMLTEQLKDHYAFMGLSKDIGTYICADGINEHGLAVAELYFEDYAKYAPAPVEGKTNLGCHEFLLWTLATCKSCQEVIDIMPSINVVGVEIPFLKRTPPLHWVFIDASGQSIVIEITDKGVEIHDNSLGVLTNSPNYEWHLTNVRNYVGLDPHTVGTRTFFDKEFKPLGQASGTFGMPGDFTAPSRFIKVLYNKLSVQQPENSEELLIAGTHVLNSVDIPKGSVVTTRATIDYTQYSSYVNCNDRSYSYRLYDSLCVVTHHLSDFDLDADQIKVIK